MDLRLDFPNLENLTSSPNLSIVEDNVQVEAMTFLMYKIGKLFLFFFKYFPVVIILCPRLVVK